MGVGQVQWGLLRIPGRKNLKVELRGELLLLFVGRLCPQHPRTLAFLIPWYATRKPVCGEELVRHISPPPPPQAICSSNYFVLPELSVANSRVPLLVPLVTKILCCHLVGRKSLAVSNSGETAASFGFQEKAGSCRSTSASFLGIIWVIAGTAKCLSMNQQQTLGRDQGKTCEVGLSCPSPLLRTQCVS